MYRYVSVLVISDTEMHGKERTKICARIHCVPVCMKMYRKIREKLVFDTVQYTYLPLLIFLIPVPPPPQLLLISLFEFVSHLFTISTPTTCYESESLQAVVLAQRDQ